jgi:AraC family transcriptional regulator
MVRYFGMRSKNRHVERVNRVLDYVGQNLDGDLSLATLSGVSGFSAYHFHRIFQGITGEALNAHVRRVRLERAALLMKTSPGKRIIDVALQSGFAGPAEFSRAFKSHFGRTASSWDRRSPLEKSKICKAPEMLSFYTLEELHRWRDAANVSVTISWTGAFRYVYIRVFEPYGNQKLVDAYYSLFNWLRDRGTDIQDVVFIGMSLDDPAVTPSEKCRYDLGVAFPQDRRGMLHDIVRSRECSGAHPPLPGQPECAARGFSIREFESQEIAALRCTGDIAHVERAWQYLYRAWLPSARFDPADMPAMEMFIKLPEEIGWETFDLQLCIPVVRL